MEKYTDLFGKLSFAMLVLYFLDIILLGTGVITKISIFSTRILFFALAILFSLPLLLKNFRNLIRQPFVISVAAFLLWVAICAVRGIAGGNRMDILKNDVFGYLNFCIVPTMLCVLRDDRRYRILCKTLIISCLAMAVLAVGVSFFDLIPHSHKYYPFINSLGIVAITVMHGSATRVFFHTASRFFLVAYLLLLVKLLNRDGLKKSVWGILGLALLILSIFLSYSRAPYGGSVIGVLVFLAALLLLNRKKLKKAVCLVLASVVVAVAMIGALSAVQRENLFKPAVYRVLLSVSYDDGSTDHPGTPTEPSNETTEPSNETTKPSNEPTEPSYDTQKIEEENLDNRAEKIRQLNQSIAKNPVFGNGLGAAIDYDNGYVEYTYQDILNKMGIVGLVLFLIPFLLQVYYWIRRTRLSGEKQEALWAAAMVGAMAYFLFIAYFNPCMNTTVGISCYGLSMAAAANAAGWKKSGQ